MSGRSAGTWGGGHQRWWWGGGSEQRQKRICGGGGCRGLPRAPNDGGGRGWGLGVGSPQAVAQYQGFRCPPAPVKSGRGGGQEVQNPPPPPAPAGHPHVRWKHSAASIAAYLLRCGVRPDGSLTCWSTRQRKCSGDRPIGATGCRRRNQPWRHANAPPSPPCQDMGVLCSVLLTVVLRAKGVECLITVTVGSRTDSHVACRQFLAAEPRYHFQTTGNHVKNCRYDSDLGQTNAVRFILIVHSISHWT